MRTLFATLAFAGLLCLGGTALAHEPGRGHGHAYGHSRYGSSHFNHGQFGHGHGYYSQPSYRAPAGFSFYGQFRPFGAYPSGSQFNRSYGLQFQPYYGGYSSWGHPYSSYSSPFRGYSSYSFGW
jgi:hypothetical protein